MNGAGWEDFGRSFRSKVLIPPLHSGRARTGGESAARKTTPPFGSGTI